MVNLPRAKGTSAETAVVNWHHRHGRHYIERHALHGVHDIGDIAGEVGLVQSVKFVGAGKPMDLSGWLNELSTMRANADRRLLMPPCGLRTLHSPRGGGPHRSTLPLSEPRGLVCGPDPRLSGGTYGKGINEHHHRGGNHLLYLGHSRMAHQRPAASMNQREHYREAERLLKKADGAMIEHATYLLAAAQVHATLATATVTTMERRGRSDPRGGSNNDGCH